MRYFIHIFLFGIAVAWIACTSSPSEKAKTSVKHYLKKHLLHEKSYKPFSFGLLDTVSKDDSLRKKHGAFYTISHAYATKNKKNDSLKQTIRFYLNQDLKVIRPARKNIDGNYGTLKGNVYWKYNDFVGDKADAGAKITLYTLNPSRDSLKYMAKADLQGDYKINNIRPGKYLFVAYSENNKDCPEDHVRNLEKYSQEIEQVFDFDLGNYEEQMEEVIRLDSTAHAVLTTDESSASAQTDKFYAIQEKARKRAEKFINALPEGFKKKIKLYTPFSYAYKFAVIRIKGERTKNMVIDFGISCI